MAYCHNRVCDWPAWNLKKIRHKNLTFDLLTLNNATFGLKLLKTLLTVILPRDWLKSDDIIYNMLMLSGLAV